MKTRFRWLSTSLSTTRIRQLAERMRSEPYTPERAHGFVLEQVRTREISGRHVERRIVESKVVDPLGAEIRQTITEFREVRFVVSSESPGVELIDAPRAPKLFLMQLGQLLQFKVPIDPVEVDPLEWLTHIEKNGINVEVQEVEYAQVAVAKSVVGLVRVSSDTADVRAAAAKFLGNRAYAVRRVSATLRGAKTSDRSVVCTLDRSGSASLPERNAANLIVDIRSALVRAQVG